jgi:hypothetical protein
VTAGGWQAALVSALAGTARQPPPGAGAGDAEGALLAAAAALAVRRLAGWVPPRADPPAVAPCPPDQRPVVSPAAELRLAGMLAEGGAELLPEWLELAAGSRLLVPPRLLPALLAHAEARPTLRRPVLAVIGERGAWLAAQVPAWDFAAVGDPEAAFAGGTRAARTEALRELRRRDPAAALERLTAGWAAEPGADRAALIACLAVGLESGDEPFLEAALGDARKEVRAQARDLLARLPGSRLAARMRGRAAAMVVHRKTLLGGRLDVSPPAELDAGMAADGVEREPLAGQGERAWWLAQVVGLVPPAAWPVDAVAAAARSEWAPAVLAGWAAGAARFQDAARAEALVLHWSGTKEDDPWARSFSPDQVVLAQAPADRDAILVRLVERSPQAGLHLAARCDHRWGARATTTVLAAVVALAKRDVRVAAHVLQQLRLCGDPSALPDVERLAAEESGVAWLDRLHAELAHTLNERAVMAKELTR